MHQFKRLTRLPVLVGAALTAMALIAPLAHAAEPAPGYAKFAGCPSQAEDAKVFQCVYSTITGGTFQMGSKEVPLANPMTLSGGLQTDGTVVATAKGGLSVVKQKVPGGVVGLTGLTWLLEFFGNESLTLYAATELAGGPTLKAGILNLPIRVHLINGLLGSGCYVGSFENPIELNLTTGTTSPPSPNEPITGKAPKSTFNSTTKITSQTGGEFVDNSFSAPGASGCTLSVFGIPISINGLVDSESGLPAAAGTNTTRQTYEQEAVGVKVVYP
jgi:hypothetical protein